MTKKSNKTAADGLAPEAVFDEKTENLLGLLKNYVPEDDIEGQWGLRWQIESGLYNPKLLPQLVEAREIQFLQGRVSPLMPRAKKKVNGDG